MTDEELRAEVASLRSRVEALEEKGKPSFMQRMETERWEAAQAKLDAEKAEKTAQYKEQVALDQLQQRRVRTGMSQEDYEAERDKIKEAGAERRREYWHKLRAG